jgi:hypothetical protein
MEVTQSAKLTTFLRQEGSLEYQGPMIERHISPLVSVQIHRSYDEAPSPFVFGCFLIKFGVQRVYSGEHALRRA